MDSEKIKVRPGEEIQYFERGVEKIAKGNEIISVSKHAADLLVKSGAAVRIEDTPAEPQVQEAKDGLEKPRKGN